MEGEVAQRRVKMISGHFAPISNDDLLLMNCSSSLNSVTTRRFDNRVYFARQGSASQGFFMRPASVEQVISAQPHKCSASANEDYSYASEVPLFSRPSNIHSNLVYRGVTQPRCTNDSYYSATEMPMFSRPAKIEPNIVNLGVTKPVSTPDPPHFARPNGGMSGHMQFRSGKKNSSAFDGSDWSPRMDVAESARDYVVTVEIPGVDANDIRVEVHDQHLIVTGKRTNNYWTMAGCQNNSIPKYHKKEIFQGPYQVTWPLPSDSNKDIVSAEFSDGLLQVIIPKL